LILDVITGLVPVISFREALRSSHWDGRDKPGHDGEESD
jgi:hypothetical protein